MVRGGFAKGNYFSSHTLALRVIQKILIIPVTRNQNQNVNFGKHPHRVHTNSHIPVALLCSPIKNLQLLFPYFKSPFVQSLKEFTLGAHIRANYVRKRPNKPSTGNRFLQNLAE